ncbi:MAG TPA: hypothetical protein VK891_08990, partial [Euzebyales bacterium]|nr:hypothetical protein [Euzebyales bacterium]
MTSDALDPVPWLARQRWFQGKAREATATTVADSVAFDELHWMILEVDYATGPSEHYQLVLRPAAGRDGQTAVSLAGSTWIDATAAPELLRPLALTAAGGGTLATAAGAAIEGDPVARHPVPAAARVLGVEQSNTSVVFGDAVLLKLFRKLEPGINPDVELTRALTAAGSTHVPPQIGALRITAGELRTELAVVSEFLPEAREGWRLAVDDAAAALSAPDQDPTGRAFVTGLTDLGAAVAQTHAALAGALPSASATGDDVARWATTIHDEATAAFTGPAPALPVHAPDVHAAIDHAAAAVTAPGLRSRIHGDLHLGQVVDSGRGWQLLDFEGEPARPLDERRALTSPVRDLAGMLRSFDYAAAAGLRRSGAAADERMPPVLVAWRDAARDRFLHGYEDRARQGVDAALLTLFELEKAIYEIGYERANRPDWLAIPVGGIRRILDASSHRVARARTLTGGAMATTTQWHADRQDVAALMEGTHRDPHHVLGLHEHADGTIVRVLRPGVAQAEVVPDDGAPVVAERTHEGGLFEALVPGKLRTGGYRIRFGASDGTHGEEHDASAFWPTLGDIDLHLAGEGRHQELWRRLGAHPMEVDGVAGTAFAVWAPNAGSVRVVGSFNDWDGRRHPMRVMGTGIWELFVPDVGPGAYYRYEVLRADGFLTLHADPMAQWTEAPPQ